MGLHPIFPTHPKLQPTIHPSRRLQLLHLPNPSTSTYPVGKCHRLCIFYIVTGSWKVPSQPWLEQHLEREPEASTKPVSPFSSTELAFLATVANEDSKQMSLVWLLLPPREVDASQRLSHITTRIKTLHTHLSTTRKTMNSLSFLLPEHDDLPLKHRQSKTPLHPQLHAIAMLSRCPLQHLDTPSCRLANSSSD